MTSTTRETKNFACIAEAVAFYFKQGYVTIDESSNSQIMIKKIDGRKCGEVIINKEGFLNVSAEALEW